MDDMMALRHGECFESWSLSIDSLKLDNSFFCTGVSVKGPLSSLI